VCDEKKPVGKAKLPYPIGNINYFLDNLNLSTAATNKKSVDEHKSDSAGFN
jgi:hypothetical protein